MNNMMKSIFDKSKGDFMSKQIRGVILEGQSCSGKTSIFNVLNCEIYLY